LAGSSAALLERLLVHDLGIISESRDSLIPGSAVILMNEPLVDNLSAGFGGDA
jgi:hypothetical protein